MDLQQLAKNGLLLNEPYWLKTIFIQLLLSIVWLYNDKPFNIILFLCSLFSKSLSKNDILSSEFIKLFIRPLYRAWQSIPSVHHSFSGMLNFGFDDHVGKIHPDPIEVGYGQVKRLNPSFELGKVAGLVILFFKIRSHSWGYC